MAIANSLSPVGQEIEESLEEIEIYDLVPNDIAHQTIIDVARNMLLLHVRKHSANRVLLK